MGSTLWSTMTAYPTIFIAAGAATAALVTGLISLTSLIISKEDKVSDSRQKWLEGLGEETAKLLAAIETLLVLVESQIDKNLRREGVSDKEITERKEENRVGLDANEVAVLRESNKELYKELNEMYFRVRLRLDPTNEKQREILPRREGSPVRPADQAVIGTIQDLVKAFYGPCNNIKGIRKLQNAVAVDTQLIIKDTWERVKRGERFFGRMRRLLIYVLALFLVGLLYAGAAAAWRSWNPAQTAPKAVPPPAAQPSAPSGAKPP
jgi:hypothetical protein